MLAGCGTSRHCSSCGAAIAIVTSLATLQPVIKTCAITTRVKGKTHDLFYLVQAKPVILEEQVFILLFLKDFTREQQLQSMEKVFLHDISNLVTGIQGLCDLIAENTDDINPDDVARIGRLTARLSKEINIQKHLLNNDFPYLEEHHSFTVKEVITEIRDIFPPINSNIGIRYSLQQDLSECKLSCDFFLFTRILINMIKNAVEASTQGAEILVGAAAGDESICFSV